LWKLGGVAATGFQVENWRRGLLRTFSRNISSNIRKILTVTTGSLKCAEAVRRIENRHGHFGEGKHNR
jgi:hypothetical protein